MDHLTAKNNIYTVLVEPRGSGNIGSVARVIMNTGMSKLVMVNPADFKNEEALQMACNANEVLDNSQVFSTLDECLKSEEVNPGLIVAVTRRTGKMRGPVYTLNKIIPELFKFAEKNNVAILFGREDKGLTNEEVQKCDMILEIPTDAGYPSLNLSHAVLLVLYKIYDELTADKEFSIPGESVRMVTREEIDEMYLHLERAMRQLGYGEKDKGGEHLLKTIMRNFRRLFGRTGMIEKELNMVRGIFTKIEQKCDPNRRAAGGNEKDTP